MANNFRCVVKECCLNCDKLYTGLYENMPQLFCRQTQEKIHKPELFVCDKFNPRKQFRGNHE